jgi:hypothetical protein
LSVSFPGEQTPRRSALSIWHQGWENLRYPASDVTFPIRLKGYIGKSLLGAINPTIVKYGKYSTKNARVNKKQIIAENVCQNDKLQSFRTYIYNA